MHQGLTRPTHPPQTSCLGAGKHSDHRSVRGTRSARNLSAWKGSALGPTEEPRMGQGPRLSWNQSHGHPPRALSAQVICLECKANQSETSRARGRQADSEQCLNLLRAVSVLSQHGKRDEYFLNPLDSLLANTHGLHNKPNMLCSTRQVFGVGGVC